MKRYGTALVLVGALALTGCTEEGQDVVSPDASVDAPEIAAKKGHAKNGKKTTFATDPERKAEIEAELTEFVRDLHTQIDARRAEAGVEAEGVTTAPIGYFWTGHVDGETAGAEVFFEDRGNKQLALQWVPGDARRNGRTDVGYAIAPLAGPAAPPGLTPAEVNGAIDRGMGTWDDQTCSKGLEVPRGSLLDWLLFDSDILHAGFASLPPGVLGVTMPSIFVDAQTGEPTDVDGDGNLDYASAIIVYNIDFAWAIDANIDVETIALHEGGHGLAQAHFGKAFLTPSNGKVHFAPRAVMNAAYSGVQQSLTGTDRGGHCSMYGSWPNN